MKQVAWGYVPSGNRILIATRMKSTDPLRSGEFVIPGGGLNPDEDYISAAIREVKEETGVDTFYRADFYFKPQPRTFHYPELHARVDGNGLIILEYTDSGKSYQGRLIGLRPKDEGQVPQENPGSDAKNPKYASRTFVYDNRYTFTPACQVLLEIIEELGV